MWRPKEGWENNYETEHEYDGYFSRAELFEAGADAMRKAVASALREIDEMCEGDAQYYNAMRHFEEELKNEKRT